jgi:hypothetical protein
MAEHAGSEVRVFGADVIPSGAGGIVEAVVVLELWSVSGLPGYRNGPVVRTAGGEIVKKNDENKERSDEYQYGSAGEREGTSQLSFD